MTFSFSKMKDRFVHHFSYWSRFWRSFILIVTPLVLLPLILSTKFDDEKFSNDTLPSPVAPESDPITHDEPTTKSNYEPMVCAYVLLIMAIYWMTEALPLPVTSLIPVVAFPLAGVISTNEIAVNYMRATNFMFLGGLMLAIGVEHSGLHKRIALHILLLLGTSPKMIMLGFMATTAFLSMWISNTATVAMMLPIVEAVSAAMYHKEDNDDVKDEKSHEEERQRNLLLMSVAYSANIGGTGVITGSPPNLVTLEILPSAAGVNFATWMAFCIPLMILNLVLAWGWLLLMGRWMSLGRSEKSENLEAAEPGKEFDSEDSSATPTKYGTMVHSRTMENILAEDEPPDVKIKHLMKKQLEKLGPTRSHEWSILICFIVLILLWFFREPKFIQGWGDLLRRTTDSGKKSTVGDATPALLMVMVIFALPAQFRFWPFQSRDLPSKNSPSLVSWELIEKKLPWGVILLLGGGFALSDACTKTGLSSFLVDRLIYLRHLPIWSINLIVSMLTTTVTEVVSNTATANILLPILKEMSLTLCENPTYLVLTSVVTCSYAFMLPVATAPNAIVYGASSMTTSDMMKAGFFMNVICVVTTNIAINTYGAALFNLRVMPEWAVLAAADANTNCTFLEV